MQAQAEKEAEKVAKSKTKRQRRDGEGQGRGRGRGGRGKPKDNSAEAGDTPEARPVDKTPLKPAPPSRGKPRVVATPRMKRLASRRQDLPPAGKSEAMEPAPAKKPRVSEATTQAKLAQHYSFLKGADAALKLFILPSDETKKSFTQQCPHDSGRSIGVIMTSGVFYVGKAEIPERFAQLMAERKDLPALHLDGKGGCSVNWKRFDSVVQASLC